MSVERRTTRRSTAENRITIDSELVEKKEVKKSAVLDVDILELKKQQGLKVKEIVERDENVLAGADAVIKDSNKNNSIQGITKDDEKEGSAGIIEEDGNGHLEEGDDVSLLKDESTLDESDSGEPEAKLLKLDVDEEATNDSAISGESAGSTNKPKRKEKVNAHKQTANAFFVMCLFY